MTEYNELLNRPLEYRARMKAQIMQHREVQALRAVRYDQPKASSNLPGDPTYNACERLERLEDEIELSFLAYANASYALLVRAKDFDEQTYTIVQHRLVNGRNMRWISENMSLPISTAYRKYKAFVEATNDGCCNDSVNDATNAATMAATIL